MRLWLNKYTLKSYLRKNHFHQFFFFFLFSFFWEIEHIARLHPISPPQRPTTPKYQHLWPPNHHHASTHGLPYKQPRRQSHKATINTIKLPQNCYHNLENILWGCSPSLSHEMWTSYMSPTQGTMPLWEERELLQVNLKISPPLAPLLLVLINHLNQFDPKQMRHNLTIFPKITTTQPCWPSKIITIGNHCNPMGKKIKEI